MVAYPSVKPHFLALVLFALPLAAQDPQWLAMWEHAQRERPKHFSSQSRLAPEGEPGDQMMVHGRIFQADGVTPVAGAIVFAYQTDATGLYHKPGEKSWRLTGWTKSDQTGAFEFATIRPAPYPARTIPAHIHFTVEGGGVRRQWTEELRFADDSFVSARERERSRADGTFGNVRPVRREGSIQHVEFNVRAKEKGDF